jgi:phage terminase large subunit
VKLESSLGIAFQPLQKPARYKGAHGGRSSGKSHAFAEMLVLRCFKIPGLRWMCVREVQQSLNESVKRLIEEKIDSMGVGAYFEIQHDRIVTPGKGVIVFVGMQNHTASSIKSYQGFDGAWVEEAQTLSMISLRMLTPTIRKDYKDGTTSEIWFSWNPHSPDDPVDQFLRGDPPGDSVVVCVNYWDNPKLPKSSMIEIENSKKRSTAEYLHDWCGEYYTLSDAMVFKNWKVEEFEVPDTAMIRQGADWGYSVDPSVLVQCYIVGKTLYVPYEAYQVGCEINFLPELFRTVPDANRWPITADSSSPDKISYLRNHGFPHIYPAVKGKRSVEEGIEFLRSFDIVVHPRCKSTIEELRKYCYKVDPLTQAVIPVLEDKNNHVIDSLRYALEGARVAQNSSNRQPATILPMENYFRKSA